MTGRPSVLVVTSELVGPFKNGGIGTATTGLVETLAGTGYPTTVLYTGAIWHVEIDMGPWTESWRRIGVELVALTLADMKRLAGPVRDQGLGSAWLVHEFIRSRRFDIVHFNDTLGEGALALAAKHLGAFPGTTMMLGLHSPTRWIAKLNRQLVDNPVYPAFDGWERLSVRSADLLWCPSDYLIRWIRDDGWVLPAQVIRQQYVMPTAALFDPDPAKLERADAAPPRRRIERIAELVFFGRLEERKGLRGFCAALDRLADRLADRQVLVTFMGKPVRLGGESSADWLRRRGADWRFPWRLETGFGQREALAYLKARACLAVMPSPWDNSPCTVYEAIGAGIPFLASATGGIPELVHEEDAARVLFPDTADGLAQALGRALADGAETVRPRIDAGENRRRWQALHEGWQAPPLPPPPPRARFAVLVDGAGEGAAATVGSLRQTLGDRIAGILVLADGGADAAPPDATLVDAARERRLDEALAAALGAVEADWVLCVAAGATLLPDAVTGLERALAAPDIGDGLIPAGRLPDGRIVPPFGGSRGFGFFEGFAYAGGAVLARKAALAALARRGVLNGAPFAGLVDLVAAARGELWPFAEALLDLPARGLRPPVTLDGARFAAFEDADPVERGLIAAVGFSAYRRAWLNRKRRLLLLASGLPGFFPAVTAMRRLVRLVRRSVGLGA